VRTLPTRTAAVSVSVTALLLVAAACVTPPKPGPGSDGEPLATLELTNPAGATVTLTCGPDGGTHPNPKAACDALRAVGGDFERLVWDLVRPDVACIDLYDPVYARATGSWQSGPGDGPTFDVDYSKEFGNSCYASLYSNVVFDFRGPGGATDPLADLTLSYPGRGKATLTCTPDGGTHPHPKAACDALRAVGGNFDKLTFVWKPGVYCIEIYDPVYAYAKGSWQSSQMGPTHLVDWSKEFGNSCYASRYSNVVFNF
jgi:hypothetical protein